MQYLIESVIQALIEAFKIQQYYCLAGLHAHFDSVDVPANLKGKLHYLQNLFSMRKYIHTGVAYDLIVHYRVKHKICFKTSSLFLP